MIPLLTERLQWRLQAFDDSTVDVSLVESLKLYVVGQEVRQNTGEGNRFPTYGPLVAYREVTKGKAGGLGDYDPL